MISEFRGKYYFLSNFYESSVSYDGFTYRNNEACFQAQKEQDRQSKYKYTNVPPNIAKKLGRKAQLRPDWEDVKYELMYEICKAKFTQNLILQKKLLATKDAELIEGNNWHDNIWGACSCETCRDKYKNNNLGIILMRIRDEIKMGLYK